ncbi:hypothetical protein B4107_1112 [Bacillus safensis]|nr:hypothetical protein B4107_1112 [Bacillus safensis]
MNFLFYQFSLAMKQQFFTCIFVLGLRKVNLNKIDFIVRK